MRRRIGSALRKLAQRVDPEPRVETYVYIDGRQVLPAATNTASGSYRFTIPG